MTVAGTPRASRIAPSPTGPLHLGNACTFLVNWALARSSGWALHLRIEDLDSARVAAAAAEVRADLEWLGITTDGDTWVQSTRTDAYAAAMERLSALGLIYQSPHSRSEVRQAAEARDAAEALSAPHAAPGGAPHGTSTAFPASLRPAAGAAWQFTQRDVNYRMRVGRDARTAAGADAEVVAVHDELQGTHTFTPADTDGDFIVWTKSGYPAYQLAVVVDDIAQGVTDVVRGADLLPSAALQTLVYRALGAPPPRWWHLPLVRDATGERLSKRKGGGSVTALRAAGVSPVRVVGLVAWWTGAQEQLAPMSAELFRQALTPSMLRAWCARAHAAPATVTPAVLEWLHAC